MAISRCEPSHPGGDVMTTAQQVVTGFVHPALFYRGLDDYLTGVGGFLRAGLEAGAPVFASVPPQRLMPLRDYLGPDAAQVTLFDMGETGRNPGRIMTALTDFADRRGAGRAWLVGEPIWATRSAAEIREATRHEALINLAFAGVPVTILCPYDISELAPATLADAERTHPVLWAGGQGWASPTYTDPMVINAECDAPDMPGMRQATAEAVPFGPAELASVRRRASQFGQAAGLDANRGVDLMLAVGEAAANAIRHGGGGGTIAMWLAPDEVPDEVVIEIRDGGRLADPLAGRRRPPIDAQGGRGLWLIHQLCDLVELGPGMVRLHLSLTPG